MNKFAKGSLAAGAGIVLLLGGAGTLAYWNDQVELTGGTINTGALTLEATEGAWDQDIVRWVPGDEATFTTTLTLDAQGDHIQGTIELDPESVGFENSTTGEAGNLTADQIAEQFDIDVEFGEVVGGEITFHDAGEGSAYDSASFSGQGVYQIPVSVTVELPFGEEPTNDAQAVQIDLSGVSFTATQTQAN